MLRRFWRDMLDSREWVETRKQLRQTRPYTLATFPEGVFGRVTGTCVAFDATLLTAPFSERKCVAYAVFAEGRTGPVHERLGVPFLLEHRGQHAIVDPRGASISLTKTMVARSQAFPRPTRKQRELLDEIVGPGIAPDAVAFTEAIIALGDELVIAGFSIRETDHAESPAEPSQASGSDPYRGVPTRLRLSGANGHPLLIANDRKLVE